MLADKIKQYVYTEGWVKPDLWYKRIEGAEFGNLCFFCKQSHSTYKKIILDNEKEPLVQSLKKREGKYPCAHICSKCDNMYQDFDYAGYPKGNPSTIADRGRETTANILQRRRDLIRAYVLTGTFDKKRLERYGIPKDKCFFCEKTLEVILYLEIPVGNSKKIANNTICCTSCKDIINFFSRKFTKGNVSINTNITNDSCKNCGDLYKITIPEHRARELSDSLGHHYCNYCMRGYEGLDRYVQGVCKTCETYPDNHYFSLSLDLTNASFSEIFNSIPNQTNSFPKKIKIEKLCQKAGIGTCKLLNNMSKYIDLGNGFKAKLETKICPNSNNPKIFYGVYDMNNLHNENSSKKNLSQIFIRKISRPYKGCSDVSECTCKDLSSDIYITAFKIAKDLYNFKKNLKK